MDLALRVGASRLLSGAVCTSDAGEGWLRPARLTSAQMRAIGSCQAWHPGYFKPLARCTSGICLEFVTDSAHVEVEVRMEPSPRGTLAVLSDVHEHGPGLSGPLDGVGVQVDGASLPLALPDERGVVRIDLEGAASAACHEEGVVRLPGMGEVHRVRVWLPCLTTALVRDVMGDGTFLSPAHEGAERGTLLVLGDSLAQGYVCVDPARCWCAQLADMMGLELLNQGIGGQVCQPGSLMDLPRHVTPAAIVVEFAANYRFEACGAGMVEREIRSYVDEVSRAWPDVPTWYVTATPHLEDVWPTHPRSCFAEVPAMVERAVARHPQMTVVDGLALLDGSDLPHLMADGADHPGPEGQDMLAERLARAMGVPVPQGDAAEKPAVAPAADADASAEKPADAPEPAPAKPKRARRAPKPAADKDDAAPARKATAAKPARKAAGVAKSSAASKPAASKVPAIKATAATKADAPDAPAKAAPRARRSATRSGGGGKADGAEKGADSSDPGPRPCAPLGVASPTPVRPVGADPLDTVFEQERIGTGQARLPL